MLAECAVVVSRDDGQVKECCEQAADKCWTLWQVVGQDGLPVSGSMEIYISSVGAKGEGSGRREPTAVVTLGNWLPC